MKDKQEKPKAIWKKPQKGDFVFAKMKGFPDWPGLVVGNEHTVPNHVKAIVKKSPEPFDKFFCIFFFGSNNFSWIGESEIHPFLENKEVFASKKTAKKASVLCEEHIEKQHDIDYILDYYCSENTSGKDKGRKSNAKQETSKSDQKKTKTPKKEITSEGEKSAGTTPAKREWRKSSDSSKEDVKEPDAEPETKKSRSAKQETPETRALPRRSTGGVLPKDAARESARESGSKQVIPKARLSTGSRSRISTGDQVEGDDKELKLSKNEKEKEGGKSPRSSSNMPIPEPEPELQPVCRRSSGGKRPAQKNETETSENQASPKKTRRELRHSKSLEKRKMIDVSGNESEGEEEGDALEDICDEVSPEVEANLSKIKDDLTNYPKVIEQHKSELLASSKSGLHFNLKDSARPVSPSLDIELTEDAPPSNLTFTFIGVSSLSPILIEKMAKSGNKIVITNREGGHLNSEHPENVDLVSNVNDAIQKADIAFNFIVEDESSAEIKDTILPEIKLGKGFVDMSNVNSEVSQSRADIVSASGGRFLEVRLQGTRSDAEEGELFLLAAGDRTLYDECHPCFSAISAKKVFLGEVGQASTSNMLLNTHLALTLAISGEVLAFVTNRNEKLRYLREPELLQKLEDFLPKPALHFAAHSLKSGPPEIAIGDLKNDVLRSTQLADRWNLKTPMTSSVMALLNDHIRTGAGSLNDDIGSLIFNK